MAKPSDPDLAKVRNLVHYVPETGRFFWLPRAPEPNQDPAKIASWNTKYAGKEAFLHSNDGYRYSGIFNRPVKAHRLAMALINGEWPTQEVDHINGDRGDNRAANLRLVTPTENRRNRHAPGVGSSKIVGVSFCKSTKKWAAYLGVRGKQLHLGRFASEHEAAQAREAAKARLWAQQQEY
jgi:hypothetical protein